MARPLDPQRPTGITRREFVKTAVAGAAAGAAGGIGFAAFQGSAPAVDDVPRFPYLGVEVLEHSKAPQGLPLVPIQVAEDGTLLGEPRHLHWYRYCSRNEAPGLFDEFSSDNVLRYSLPHDRVEVAQSLGTWWRDRDGRPMRAEHFQTERDGALASWRSEGQIESNHVGVVVIRVDPEQYDEPVRSEYVADGFLGVSALCAHFCCVPVYRLGDGGYHAGHDNDIVCDCHGSWYDPYSIKTYQFPPTG